MRFIKEDIFESGADVILVAGNSYIKKNGALTMGRGSARQLQEEYPGIEFILGQKIKEYFGHLGFYGCFGVSYDSEKWVGVIQTKYHFRDKSDPSLIKKSLDSLVTFKENFDRDSHKCDKIAITYPGIGFGKLKKSEVEPLLLDLPDYVDVYYLED